MKRIIYFLVLLIIFSKSFSATIYTSSQDGAWDLASTWGGIGVPTSGDYAFINHHVTASGGQTDNRYVDINANGWLEITSGDRNANGLRTRLLSATSKLSINAGSLNMAAAPFVSVEGSTITVSGTISISTAYPTAAYRTLAGSVSAGSITLTNSANLILTGTTTVSGNLTTSNVSTLDISSSGSLTLIGTTTISNTSVITNSGTFISGAMSLSGSGAAASPGATFSSSGTSTINGNVSLSSNCASFNVTGGTTTVTGNLTMDDTGSWGTAGLNTNVTGGTLNVTGATGVSIGTNASLNVSSGVTVSITNDIYIQHGNSSISFVSNNGTLNARSFITATGWGTAGITNGSTNTAATITLTGNLNATSTTVTNYGVINATSGNINIASNSAFSNLGTINAKNLSTLSGGSVTNGSTSNSTATLNISGNSIMNGGGSFWNFGKVNNTSSSGYFAYNCTGGFVNCCTGVVSIAGNAYFYNPSSGIQQSAGKITVDGQTYVANNSMANSITSSSSPCYCTSAGIFNAKSGISFIQQSVSYYNYATSSTTTSTGNGCLSGGSLNYTPCICFNNQSCSACTNKYAGASVAWCNLSTTTLPIDLVSFGVEIVLKNSILVSWQTASEKNTEYYNVEKSGNGNDFGSIGSVPVNDQMKYSFIDDQPIDGLNYYRLKQHTIDGETDFSKIISVKFKSIQNNITNISPNLVKSGGTMFVDLKESKSEVIINVYDANGQQIGSYSNNFEQKVAIPTNYVSGIYYLGTSGSSAVYKFIVQ